MGILNPPPGLGLRAQLVQDPLLVFGGDRRCADQKMGLAMYGPAPGVDGDERPIEIQLGMIGTGKSIESAVAWMRKATSEIWSIGRFGGRTYFPGMNTASPLRCVLKTSSRIQIPLTQNQVSEAVRPTGVGDRIDGVAKLFAEGFEALSASDPRPDVILCPLPEDVIEKCVTSLDRFGRFRSRRRDKEPRLVGRQATLDDYLPSVQSIEAEETSWQHYGNLWRALKIEAMRHQLPLQVVWPRTLEQGEGVQDAATVAWNLYTGLYYKVRGRLWHLPDRPDQTCYVGLSFYHEQTRGGDRLNCSMAQIFSDSGDGLVFRGGALDSNPALGLSPRLDYASSRNIVERCLRLYRTKVGTSPARLVVHKSSRYSIEEREGIEAAATGAGVTGMDLVTIEPRSPYQFYREGRYPPLRGTAIRMPDGRWLLYSRGYVPILQTYAGPATPSPVSILEHHGTSSVDRVLEDIMGLTRLNWNSTDHSALLPVTLGFSKRVGSVLSEYRVEGEPGSQLKFYM